jgi:hypothetical protein
MKHLATFAGYRSSEEGLFREKFQGKIPSLVED